MPRNGSGAYSLPQAAFVPGTTISSTAVNSDFTDIATALTGSIAADGQTPITGPLKFDDGTPVNPSITFTTDNTDGFNHPAAGQVGVALNSTQAFIFGVQSAAAGSGLLGAGGVVLNPIGVIHDFGGSSAPTGWLLCFGQAVSRLTYFELFTVLGTAFGIGDGTTTFNLPDCRGRIGVGKDDMGGTAVNRITVGGCGISGVLLGAVGGEQTHSLTEAENGPHAHGGFTGNPTTHPDVSSGSVVSQVGEPGSGRLNPTSNTNLTLPDHVHAIPSSGSGTGHNNVQPTIIFNKIIFAGH